SLAEFVDCTFSWPTTLSTGAPGHVARGGSVKWENCSLTGGALSLNISASKAVFGGNQFANWIIEGCDLSNLPTGVVLTGPVSVAGTNPNTYYCFKDCKFPSSFVAYDTGDASIRESVTVDFVRCDSGGTAYRNDRDMRTGTQTTWTAVVRTNGAADGATPISHKVDVTANATFTGRFNALPLTIWNGVTGSNRNVTLYGVASDSRVPNDDEFWFDVEYLGQSGSPDGDFKRGSKSNVLASASALTADTSTWDSGATARAN